jgi:hypothetical protein
MWIQIPLQEHGALIMAAAALTVVIALYRIVPKLRHPEVA